MSEKLQFLPVSHSWVAIHSHPQGVVQFIGGAFFGTFFPMRFYNSLLQAIFNAGYTIIIMPFNFTFNHYVEAGFLIKEQYDIIPELVRIALRNGYKFSTYFSDENFYWLGHSIGCKYISLLEGFSALPENSADERKEWIRDLIRKEVEFTLNVKVPEKCDDPKNKICRIVNNNTDSVSGDIEVLIKELERKYIQAFELVIYYLGQYLPQYIEQEFSQGKITAAEKDVKQRELKQGLEKVLGRIEKFKEKYFGRFSKSPGLPELQYKLRIAQSVGVISPEVLIAALDQKMDRLENDELIDIIFTKDQASILLAPVNSGTESAIPKPLADIVDALGLGVKPSPHLTFNLILKGDLFNLLGLVSFQKDKLAEGTVAWFDKTFKKPPVVDGQGKSDFRKQLQGGHLEPLGFRPGNSLRPVESSTIELLQNLRQKRIEASKQT